MRLQKLKNVTKLAENFYLIQAPNQARFPHCNGFLFTHKETVLIDSGIGEAKIREIDQILRIDILIISHPHLYHILAWHILKDRHLLYPKEMPESIFQVSGPGTVTQNKIKDINDEAILINGIFFQTQRHCASGCDTE